MFGQEKIEYKTPEEMKIMQKAALVTSAMLDAVLEAAKPSVTTAELDDVAREVLKKNSATSNFLGYFDYPAVICTSVNDEVVHGIPGPRKLYEGDILSVDGGAIVNGYNGDSARTKIIGSPEQNKIQEIVDLSEATRLALWAGIAAMDSVSYVNEIGHHIEDYVSSLPNGNQYGILEDYVGHGIGTKMHQPPDVFNYRTAKKGPKLKAGMCLAIEPMLVLGSIETDILDDQWTVVTSDQSYAAHWEHSVAKHDKGIWVLTSQDGGAKELEKFGVTPVPIP